MRVLALEASTQAAKAIVYDREAGVSSLAQLPYPEGTCDIVTQDAEAMAASVFAAGRQALKASPGPIDGVAISSIWHSLLPLDRDRRPLGPIRTWANTQAAPTVAHFRRDGALTAEFYQRTGCMVHSMYPLWQYMHLKRCQPEALSGMASLSSQSAYLFERLTGREGVSTCTASGSGFYNIHTGAWDERALAFCDLEPEQIGRLMDPEDTQPLCRAAAEALGLPAGTPVCPGGGDGALNQIGSGATAPGIMTFSVGTSGAIRMAVDQPVLPERPSTWCYALAEGKRIAGAATSGAGNCVDWLRKTVLGGRYDFAQLEALAAEVDRGAAPVFLPFLYGERCPGWQDARRGGYVGLSGQMGVGELYYALLEGVLMNIYHCYQILTEAAGQPRQIRITGGIERSPLWLQMAADLFGAPMTTATIEHASILGAAALALKACGGIDRLADFDAPTGRAIAPQIGKRALYDARFQQYLAAYQAQVI